LTAAAWDSAVALAEKLRAAVYQYPLLDRASFPENHPLFAGPLGNSIKGISDSMAGHDVVVMIGGEVFQYYPYVPGDYLPEGTQLLQITAIPYRGGRADGRQPDRRQQAGDRPAY
jgi:benzoylformate decarboxylase